MDYQAMRVVYHYVCRGEILENIAQSGEHDYPYDSRAGVTKCVKQYGFTTAKDKDGYGQTGKSCGIFPDMTFEEFCAHMMGYDGKDGSDFQEKVALDRERGLDWQSVLPEAFPKGAGGRQTGSPDGLSYTSRAEDSNGIPKSRMAVIGGVCFITVIIVAVFLIRGISGGGPLNSKNAVNEIQHFTPVLLSGLMIGEMFDGACSDGAWSTYEVENRDGLFNTKTTWVRFIGSSRRGNINATFTLTHDRLLDYTCYVDGHPAALDELYRMFYDPNYDNALIAEAAEAENEAKFNDAEERIQKMAIVHNHVIADFKGMTVLEFIDAVCTDGEWVSNDRTETLRVIFDGSAEKGAVQVVFDVDEALGTVESVWYFNSREVTAADMYHNFYPE